jgi:non-ribosomal peptide synthetase component F
LRVRGLGGENLRLYVPELWGTLKDGGRLSRVKRRKDRLTLCLVREADRIWERLAFS